MEITPDIVTAFRAFFKDFADLDKWPDDIVITALYEADTETGGTGWGAYQDIPQNFKRRGMFYFAAAWLSSNFGDGGVGDGISSEARLNVGSKSIGDESITYRTPSMMEVNNDWLTYTVYGQQFYRLRRRAGMGARVA
jgi:hypothetical protein